MTTRIRLDVYGMPMQAEHDDAGWRIYRLGADGKRREVHLAVPDFIQEHEIDQYLDDIYHEMATPAHNCVRRLAD